LGLDWKLWKLTITYSLPFFLANLFAIINARIDTVLISVIQGDTVTGWYSAAKNFLIVVNFFPITFTATIYPISSRYHLSSKESQRILSQKSFMYLIIIGLPAAAGTIMLADKMIFLIFGVGFSEAVIALQILACTFPLFFLSNLSNRVFASMDRQDLILKIGFISILTNLLASLVLIPIYSYIGAAIAAVTTALVSLILNYYILSKYIQISIAKIIAKSIIACIVMVSAILLIMNFNFLNSYSLLNILFIIGVSVFVYFITLIVLKTFSTEDFRLFKQIFVTKKN
jgi:O-antigen/teichoic acid export membrane protein